MTLRKWSTLIGLIVGFSLIVGAGPAKNEKDRSVVRPAAKTSTAARQDVKVDVAPTTTPETVNHLSPDILDAPTTAGATATYDIPWSSVNGGGAPSSSTNYSVNASVGQSAIGFATSTNYQAGIGYWYGAEAAGGGCNCPFQADFDESGARDAVDLNLLIDILFFNAPDIQDPDCPATRSDFDYSGAPDAVDLNQLIDHLFFNGPEPVDPCA